jgi:hypothetical protein
MTDFLDSLKADLLDRRLLPILALLGVALVAALGYLVLGGGSTAATPPAVRPIAHAPAGIAVSQTPANPAQAAAETTSGSSAQRHGYAHDPFNALPVAAKQASSTAVVSSSRSGAPATSGTPSTTSTKSGSGATPKSAPQPAAPTKPSAPHRATTVYKVSVVFGALPVVAPPQGVQLTPFQNLRLLTPLPSAQQPLIVFRGVTLGGKSASFTVVGEVLLHGNARCLPSTSQCQEINLKTGQVEQLEYLAASGQVVTYELRILDIAATKASSAGLRRIQRGVSKPGGAVLLGAGLVAIPELRYSSVPGVLVYLGHPAHSARAHAALQRRHRG